MLELSSEVHIYITYFVNFCLLMHINVFGTVFAEKTCSTAPYQLCQRMYCAQCWLMSQLTRYLCMKVTEVSVTWLVRPWNLRRCPAELDGDQRLMLYWIDPVDAADRLDAKSELAESFTFTMKGRSRSKTSETNIWSCQFRIGFSGSAAHRYAQCSFHDVSSICCMGSPIEHRNALLFCRKPFEYSWRSAAKPLDSCPKPPYKQTKRPFFLYEIENNEKIDQMITKDQTISKIC